MKPAKPIFQTVPPNVLVPGVFSRMTLTGAGRTAFCSLTADQLPTGTIDVELDISEVGPDLLPIAPRGGLIPLRFDAKSGRWKSEKRIAAESLAAAF